MYIYLMRLFLYLIFSRDSPDNTHARLLSGSLSSLLHGLKVIFQHVVRLWQSIKQHFNYIRYLQICRNLDMNLIIKTENIVDQ